MVVARIVGVQSGDGRRNASYASAAKSIFEARFEYPNEYRSRRVQR